MRHGCAGLGAFSPREQQVVDLLLSGRQMKEIAAELGLSVNTVREYAKSIYQKAAVQSARELLARAASGGGPPLGHVEALLAIAEARDADSLVQACVTALRRWARPREILTIEVADEGCIDERPSVARGLLLRGGAARITPALAYRDVLLHRHLESKVLAEGPVVAALRMGRRRWLILLLEPTEDLDAVAVVSAIVSITERQMVGRSGWAAATGAAS